MKLGEIILLWVAGLWTSLLSLFTASDLKWLIVASLPVWIICGLIWVTIYKLEDRRESQKPLWQWWRKAFPNSGMGSPDRRSQESDAIEQKIPAGMKKCPQCEKQIMKTAFKCTSCGARI